MNTYETLRPAIGFRVTVRDDAVSYARLVRPDPVALGCLAAPEVGGLASALPRFGNESDAGVSCDGATVLRELDRAHRRREVAPWIPLVGVFLVWIVIAAVLLARGSGIAVASAVAGSILVTWIGYRIAQSLDAAAGASLLVYDLDESSAERYARIQAAAQQLALADRTWHVASEGRLLDPSQKYGARRFLRRYRIRPRTSMPARTRMNLTVPTVYGESRKYFFAPDRVLVYDDRGVRALGYDRLAARTSEVLVVEDEDVPADARVIESTWLHLGADGGPDPAVANNRRYPIVLYGALELVGPAGVRELFHGSVPNALEAFASALEWMACAGESDEEESAEKPDDASPHDTPIDDVGDELFEASLRFLVGGGVCDLGVLAHRFGVTFGRAARLLAVLEHEGFVGPAGLDGQRDVRRSAFRFVELLDRAFPEPHGEARKPKARTAALRRGRGRKLEPHEVLGVSESASRADVAEAYREIAQLYHPDKVATLAPEFQELADQRMKEINAAYTALTGGADADRRAARR